MHGPWFFSNMAMDENMVDESTYWEEFGKLTIYATCMAEHKENDVIPGVVMAPHDSNLKVPYKAWCYLRWLEATNLSRAEDYATWTRSSRSWRPRRARSSQVDPPRPRAQPS